MEVPLVVVVEGLICVVLACIVPLFGKAVVVVTAFLIVLVSGLVLPDCVVGVVDVYVTSAPDIGSNAKQAIGTRHWKGFINIISAKSSGLPFGAKQAKECIEWPQSHHSSYVQSGSLSAMRTNQPLTMSREPK